MIYCNDYIKLTKNYLRNMGYYQVAVANMTDDIQDMAEDLKEISAKIANYEQNAGGGSGELNAVESAAARRVEQADAYKQQVYELQKLQRQVRKLERCIDSLPKDEKEAVRLYYIHKLSYDDMVDSLHVSHSTCKRRIKSGTRAVAIMLFGDKAGNRIQFAS